VARGVIHPQIFGLAIKTGILMQKDYIFFSNEQVPIKV